MTSTPIADYFADDPPVCWCGHLEGFHHAGHGRPPGCCNVCTSAAGFARRCVGWDPVGELWRCTRGHLTVSTQPSYGCQRRLDLTRRCLSEMIFAPDGVRAAYRMGGMDAAYRVLAPRGRRR